MRRNVIYDLARFNWRSQQEGELAKKFIFTLYMLAERCEYGVMKEELIRDKLVVGIRDTALSERLQLNPRRPDARIGEKGNLTERGGL